MIACFKLSDAKPLASIRYRTLDRNDAVDVLKSVMKKSPGLIIDDLPNWLACHRFDRNSWYYSSAREEAFEYLTFFAAQSVLEKALAIVKRNEHYKIASVVTCCDSQDHFPRDLFDRINVLLNLVKTRNAFINELAILPKVLVDLMLEYTTCDTI